MALKFITLIIISLSIIACGAQYGANKPAKATERQLLESEPVNIEIEVNESNLQFDKVDLSLSKRIETNFNMCLENRLFSITLTNEIDTVTLGNNLINANICEESIFSCDGTNSLHQTGARIIICPK